MAKQKKQLKEDIISKSQKIPIKAIFSNNIVLTENSDEARDLYNQSRYGILLESGKVQLSLIEAAYLYEKNTIQIVTSLNKKIEFEKFIKKTNKLEPNFWVRYQVFKDIRNTG